MAPSAGVEPTAFILPAFTPKTLTPGAQVCVYWRADTLTNGRKRRWGWETIPQSFAVPVTELDWK